jgi:predicted MFS family arabinose efflux permease
MLILRVFIPFAAGYLISYGFRVVNAAIAQNLVQDLGIGPGDLGLLTSAYFLTFAAVQIPLGIYLDRFGPRRTEAALLIVAAVGAVVFASSSSLAGLVVGRALIGLGVSACLMAGLTAYVLWFPKERLVLANAAHMAAGGLGALVATAPVQWALGFIGWRGLFLIAAAFTVGVAAFVYAVVPREGERAAAAPTGTSAPIGYGEVFRSSVFWRIAPITVTAQSTFLAIHGLWAGPWLRDVGGFQNTGEPLFLISCAMVVGMLSMGWVIERLGRVGVPIMSAVVPLVAVFVAIQAAIIFGAFDPVLPGWILFGLFGNGGVLAFAALSHAFPKSIAGRVVSALNLVCILGAWAAQWGIGLVIELWAPLSSGGYPAQAYQAAFGMMIVLQALAIAWYIGFRAEPRR